MSELIEGNQRCGLNGVQNMWKRKTEIKHNEMKTMGKVWSLKWLDPETILKSSGRENWAARTPVFG